MASVGDLSVNLTADLSGMTRAFAQARSQITSMNTELSGMRSNNTSTGTSFGGLGSMAGGALSSLAGFTVAGLAMGAISGVLSIVGAGFSLVKSGIDVLKDSMVSLIKTGIEYNANVEDNQAAFETMLGSASKAKDMLSQIRVMAAKTPFETSDLTAGTKVLLAYGVAEKDILPDMKMIGDVAMGNKEKFKSLSMSFGQVASLGKLTGDNLREMAMAGFNPLQVMSKKTGKSMAVLRKEMEAGKISFKMLEDSMKTATSKGGMFYGSMDKASATFNGQISTMKDNFGTFAGIITKPIFDVLSKTALPALTKIGGVISDTFQKKGLVAGFDSLVSTVVPGFNGMATVVGVVKTAWTELKAGFQGNLSGDLTPLQAFFQQLGVIIKQVITYVKNIDFGKIFETFKGYVQPFIANWDKIKISLMLFFSSAQGAGKSWFDTLKTVFTTVTTQIIPAFMKFLAVALPIIITFFSVIMVAIKIFYGIFKAVFEALAPIVVALYNAVTPIISAVINTIIAVVRLGMAIFKGDWSGAWNAVKSILSSTWTTLKLVVSGAFNVIKAVIQGALNFVTSLFGMAKTNITSAAVGIYSSVSSWFSKVASSIINAISGLPGKVGGYFSSMASSISGIVGGIASSAYNWGANIVQGIISGISSMATKVANTASSIASTIKSFFPNSPAKRGALTTLPTWGVNIVDMLGEGMTKQIPKLNRLTEGIATGIDSRMMGLQYSGNISNVAKNYGTQVKQTIQVNTYLDGKKVAQSTAPHMVDMLKRQGV
jgi:tape measure domain-containing protein